MDAVKTLLSIMFSDAPKIISIAWTQQSTFIPSMFPALRILLMLPHKGNMVPPFSYYYPSPFPLSYSPSSLILNQSYQSHSCVFIEVAHIHMLLQSTLPLPLMQQLPVTHSMPRASDNLTSLLLQADSQISRQRFLTALSLPPQPLARPCPYCVGLVIHSSPLWPHFLAVDCLKLWCPALS